MSDRTHIREIRHFHICAGLGGGARGFNRGQARVGNLEARFRCLGGVDVDPAACADFERLAGVPAVQMDLFSRDDYVRFHGHEPPRGWREALPQDLQAAAGFETPHLVFTSSPCKGFSGLLSEKLSQTDKYQALNNLTLRSMWLALEAWADDPPEFFLFENVPRVARRGSQLLDRIRALLQHYGYEHSSSFHDCGELGGLGQSRRRFLLVGRHRQKVPPFLYEPPKRPLRGVGEILERLPMPGDPAAGPMHRVPSLHWKTWVRLAFVEPGADWRSLNRLNVVDGVLSDFGIVPVGGSPRAAPLSIGDPAAQSSREGSGFLGVNGWSEHSGTITGNGRPGAGAFSVADPRGESFLDFGRFGVGSWGAPAATVTSQRSPGQGRFSVADPRVDGHPKSVQLGVRPWHKPAGVVTGAMFAGGGPHSVADPRVDGPRFNNVFRVVRWSDASPAVAGPGGPGGGLAVADPRGGPGRHVAGEYRMCRLAEPANTVIEASTTGKGAFAVTDPRATWGAASHCNKLKVVGFDASSPTVTGSDRVGSGALSVADPRPLGLKTDRANYATAHHYGVVDWSSPTGAIPGFAKNNNGAWSVADPRPQTLHEPLAALPQPDDRLVAIILTESGCWHRPFTTLELAALQSLFDPEDGLELEGKSDAAIRERIGNAVPSDSAAAIASVMGRTLLLAWSGETFMLSADPIWVRPLTIGLSVDQSHQAWML